MRMNGNECIMLVFMLEFKLAVHVEDVEGKSPPQIFIASSWQNDVLNGEHLT